MRLKSFRLPTGSRPWRKGKVMLRRYLVALVAGLIGLGLDFIIFEVTGVFWPWLSGLLVLGLGGGVMAFGERLGLVPPAHEVGNPTSLFTDEKGRKR